MYFDLSYVKEWPFFLFIFLLGLALGSFLNSWIWRMWTNMAIINARSICPHCARQLLWYENIPVFSYIILKGRCGTCKKLIPWYYTAIELITPVLLVFIAWFRVVNNPGEYQLFARDILFIVILIVIFVFDLLHEMVLVGLVWLGIIFGFVMNYFYIGISFPSMLLGALSVGGFFFLQFIFSRGRWIGGGDIHIGIMMGIWLGWPEALVALFLAYVLGAGVAVVLLLSRKKEMQSHIPFGTFLALGTFIAIYWGEEIVGWYQKMIM